MQKSVEQEEIEQHCMNAMARKRNKLIKERKKMKKFMAFGNILLVLVLIVSLVGCANREVVSNEYLEDLTLVASEAEMKAEENKESSFFGSLAAEQILEMQDFSEIKFDENGIFRKDYPVVIDGQDVKLSVALDQKIVELIIDELLVNNGLKDTPENRAKFEEKALEIHLGNQAVDAECDYMQTAPILPMEREEYEWKLTSYIGMLRERVIMKDIPDGVTEEELSWATEQVVDVVEKYLALIDTTTNYGALYEEYSKEVEELMNSLARYF